MQKIEAQLLKKDTRVVKPRNDFVTMASARKYIVLQQHVAPFPALVKASKLGQLPPFGLACKWLTGACSIFLLIKLQDIVLEIRCLLPIMWPARLRYTCRGCAAGLPERAAWGSSFGNLKRHYELHQADLELCAAVRARLMQQQMPNLVQAAVGVGPASRAQGNLPQLKSTKAPRPNRHSRTHRYLTVSRTHTHRCGWTSPLLHAADMLSRSSAQDDGFLWKPNLAQNDLRVLGRGFLSQVTFEETQHVPKHGAATPSQLAFA